MWHSARVDAGAVGLDGGRVSLDSGLVRREVVLRNLDAHKRDRAVRSYYVAVDKLNIEGVLFNLVVRSFNIEVDLLNIEVESFYREVDKLYQPSAPRYLPAIALRSETRKACAHENVLDRDTVQ